MPRVDPSAAILVALSILYPLLAAISVRVVGPGWVILGLCVLLVARGLLGLRDKIPGAMTWGLLAVAITIAAISFFNRDLAVRLYPAVMNASMLVAFAATLINGPPMIERLARIAEPELPQQGVRWTRKVTWVWVGFFIVNGAIAIWTALYADWRVWTLYNGLIAYIAMGALLAGEFLLRGIMRAKDAKTSAP
ncbi:MAG: hypothetical protein ABW199_06665 [Caulobacterales bacterium]